MAFELIRPFKDSITLIRFSFGNTDIYATTWKTKIVHEGNPYLSEPGIQIEMPKQSGGLNEDPLKIELPLTRKKVNSQIHSMATEIASTRAVPKTHIDIFTNLIDGSDQKFLHIYEGTMERSRTNPEGKRGVVALEFASELRYGLDRITLGRRCDPECDLVFGGNGCSHPGANGGALFGITANVYPNHKPSNLFDVCSGWVNCVLDPINARLATLQLDPVLIPEPVPAPPAGWRELTLSEMDEGYWLGSFLTDLGGNGVRIKIQSWEQGTNLFVLAQLPPKSWDNRSLFLQVDCPRTEIACAQRFNSDRFSGLGYGIPAYNPTLEVPAKSRS